MKNNIINRSVIIQRVKKVWMASMMCLVMNMITDWIENKVLVHEPLHALFY